MGPLGEQKPHWSSVHPDEDAAAALRLSLPLLDFRVELSSVIPRDGVLRALGTLRWWFRSEMDELLRWTWVWAEDGGSKSIVRQRSSLICA